VASTWRLEYRRTAAARRRENGLLLWTDSERRRRTGRWLHALRVEVGRQVARVGAAAGVVGAQHWRSASARLEFKQMGTILCGA
jgi:hypothetical protein